MESIIKELKELGYEGNIIKGSDGHPERMKDYTMIQFSKKGNGKLIKGLIENGWEKEGEFKLSSPFEIEYSGYSMYISFKKYY